MKWKWKTNTETRKKQTNLKTLFSTILCFHCELGSLNFDVGLIFPVATTTSLPDAVPYCVDVLSPDERSAALEPGECVRTVDKPAVLDTYPRECYKARDKRQSCFAGIAVPSLPSAVWLLAEHSLTFFFFLEDRLVHKLTRRISRDEVPPSSPMSFTMVLKYVAYFPPSVPKRCCSISLLLVS